MKALRRKRVWIVFVVAVLGVFGLTGGVLARNSDGNSGPVVQVRDSNYQLLKVAQAVPAFGGFKIVHTPEPTLVVYLTDSSQKAAAVDAIADEWNEPGLRTMPVEIKPATYRMLDLYNWYAKLTDQIWQIHGVVFTDLAEQSNNIQIGVSATTSVVEVSGVSRNLGIPTGAVHLVVTSPPKDVSTIRDATNTMEGGLQIASATGTCTLGFVATRDTTKGFVTASHCSTHQYSLDYTDFYQPTTSDTLIGTEITDPGLFTHSQQSSCPSGSHCRFSDSDFSELASGVDANQGYIERITSSGLTIVGNWNITSWSSSAPTVGMSVNHIGRTTGWKSGQVTNSCVNVIDGDGLLLCQVMTSMDAGFGDSGGPVFTITNNSNYEVELDGIVFGITVNSSGQTSTFYSPTDLIFDDLGETSSWYVCSSSC